MKSLRMDRLAILFILVWSSGYVVGSIATQVIAPLSVTLWRFVVAAAVLGMIARMRGEVWPRGVRQLAPVALTGVLMFGVQFGGRYIGLAAGMPASTTALIACSAPLLVALGSAALRWDRLSTLQWVGIALGVVGVVVTLADRLGRPPSAGALAWTVLGLLGLTAGTLLQSRLSLTAGPAALASVQVSAAIVVLAVWAPLEGSLRIPLTTHALLSFLWLAAVTGVGAPLLLIVLIRNRGATRASSLLFVVPAVTAIASWPILGHRVGPTAVLGLVVAAAGMWLVTTRRNRQAADVGSTDSRNATVDCQAAADAAA